MAKVKATGDKEEPGSQKKVKKAKPGSFQGLGLSPPVFKAIMRCLGCMEQVSVPVFVFQTPSCMQHVATSENQPDHT